MKKILIEDFVKHGFEVSIIKHCKDEEIASIEKELLEEGYLIYGVSYWNKQGNQYLTISAKKIREGIEKCD